MQQCCSTLITIREEFASDDVRCCFYVVLVGVSVVFEYYCLQCETSPPRHELIWLVSSADELRPAPRGTGGIASAHKQILQTLLAQISAQWGRHRQLWIYHLLQQPKGNGYSHCKTHAGRGVPLLFTHSDSAFIQHTRRPNEWEISPVTTRYQGEHSRPLVVSCKAIVLCIQTSRSCFAVCITSVGYCFAYFAATQPLWGCGAIDGCWLWEGGECLF